MELGLKDKVVLVTGGASGIGEAVVRGAAHEGALVVIADRNAASLEAISKSLQTPHLTVTEELTAAGAAQRIVDAAVKKFGRIDVLVNNAGVNDGVSLEDGTVDGFRESLEKNLVQVYALAKAALPWLKTSQGAIVNIGSKVSITGQGATSGYAAAKGGVNSLTREWAVELLPFNVRVNSVLPAECETPAYTTWLKNFPDPDAVKKTITDRIPLGKRMTTPEEIASMVLFLASPKSSHTTGQIIFVDGGYTHLDRRIQ